MWLFKYRELIKNLVISDLRVRYKNSILGFGWSILNPLLIMSILVFVFSHALGGDTENFPLFVLCGLTAWRFFANGTSACLYSLISRSHMIKRIYFPRSILVFSVVLSNMISIILEFCVFFIFLVFMTHKIHATLLLFPLVLLLEFILVFGIGMFLSVTTVFFRDMAQIWEVVLQAGFFMTPIVYPVTVIPSQYLSLYLLNPMTIILLMYRDIFLRGNVPGISSTLAVCSVSVLIYITAYSLFKRFEMRIAEEI